MPYIWLIGVTDSGRL